jgi:N-acetylglucosaminyldiphosphoundecaprenol N-acetyl-beta-D-mannosaminyltransferase
MSVFDVDCFCGRFDDAVDLVIERALSGLAGYVVQGNVHVLMTAQREPELMRALHDAWLVMPDGAPIAWLQRRRGAAVAGRVGGPDLMLAVIDKGRKKSLRHFLLGSSTDVLRNLLARLEAAYEGSEIVGSCAPPFGRRVALGDAAAATAGTGADIVWVALGAPKQELWLRDNADHLGSALAIGVGAAFEFHAGFKTRAPGLMRRLGLEWAHRLSSEPRRLTGRYLTTNTRFILRVAPELVNRRRFPQ